MLSLASFEASSLLNRARCNAVDLPRPRRRKTTIHDLCGSLGGVQVCPLKYPLPQLSVKPISAMDSRRIHRAVRHVLYAGEPDPGPLFVSPEEFVPENMKQQEW